MNGTKKAAFDDPPNRSPSKDPSAREVDETLGRMGSSAGRCMGNDGSREDEAMSKME